MPLSVDSHGGFDPTMPTVNDTLPLEVHPWRQALYEELHSRPSPLIQTPCAISHIAIEDAAAR